MARHSLIHQVSSTSPNLSPLVILATFFLVYLATAPWRPILFYNVIGLFLVAFPFVVLSIITYILHEKLERGSVRSPIPGQSPSDRSPSDSGRSS